MPPLRQRVDDACAAAGRDPASLARTMTIRIACGEEAGDGSSKEQPLVGTPEALAEAFRGFAREGVSHLQLLLTPNTEASLESLAPVLDLVAGNEVSHRPAALWHLLPRCVPDAPRQPYLMSWSAAAACLAYCSTRLAPC
jgi:hypothetical protein